MAARYSAEQCPVLQSDLLYKNLFQLEQPLNLMQPFTTYNSVPEAA
jgi:hypothetical protein